MNFVEKSESNQENHLSSDYRHNPHLSKQNTANQEHEWIISKANQFADESKSNFQNIKIISLIRGHIPL